MPNDDPLDLKRIDQEIRINELREKVREIAGGEMHSFESPGAPPELLEEFWNNVKAYEEAPPTSDFHELSKAGFEFPLPEEMDDDQLHAKLWELINELAKRNTFLYQTDHLSDRELYAHLVEESLHEMRPLLPEEFSGGGDGWCCTIDILGGCSEEDIDTQHTYFASDEDRASWLEQFPDYKMPEKKPKPYDRDSKLPVRREERERREWLADMHAQGFTDEDIKRMQREEMEQDEREERERGNGNDGEEWKNNDDDCEPLTEDDLPY